MGVFEEISASTFQKHIVLICLEVCGKSSGPRKMVDFSKNPMKSCVQRTVWIGELGMCSNHIFLSELFVQIYSYLQTSSQKFIFNTDHHHKVPNVQFFCFYKILSILREILVFRSIGMPQTPSNLVASPKFEGV